MFSCSSTPKASTEPTRRAAEILGFDPQDIPLPPDGYRAFPAAPGIKAGSVIFLGVAPLRKFGYSDIRLFGRRACPPRHRRNERFEVSA